MVSAKVLAWPAMIYRKALYDMHPKSPGAFSHRLWMQNVTGMSRVIFYFLALGAGLGAETQGLKVS